MNRRLQVRIDILFLFWSRIPLSSFSCQRRPKLCFISFSFVTMHQIQSSLMSIFVYHHSTIFLIFMSHQYPLMSGRYIMYIIILSQLSCCNHSFSCLYPHLITLSNYSTLISCLEGEDNTSCDFPLLRIVNSVNKVVFALFLGGWFIFFKFKLHFM